MTPDAIVQAFEELQANYRSRFQADDATAALWLRELQHVSDADGLEAVRRHLRTEEWPPTIAAIRRACATGDAPTGAEAWEDVLRAIRDAGSFGRPICRHPLSQRAMEATGIQRIQDGEDRGVVYAQFERIYRGLCEATERDEVSALVDGERRSGKTLGIGDLKSKALDGWREDAQSEGGES